MTDHTPEPWRATVLHNGEHVTVYEGADKELSERLVACWAACAGIPTKRLGDVKALVEAARVAEHWLDDVLRPLKGALDTFRKD